MSAGLPFADELRALLAEYRAEKTAESIVAHDADQLEMLLALKEQLDQGVLGASDWTPFVLRRLRTENAQHLAQRILDGDSASWWFDRESRVVGPRRQSSEGPQTLTPEARSRILEFSTALAEAGPKKWTVSSTRRMMMGGRKTILTLAIALAVAGCSTSAKDLPVRTDYSKTTAFHEWKTFRFASVEHKAPPALSTRGTSSCFRVKSPMNSPNAGSAASTTARRTSGSPLSSCSGEIPRRRPCRRAAERTPWPGRTVARRRAARSPSRCSIQATSEALWIGQVAEFKVTAVEPQKQLNNAVWRVLVEFPPITG